MVKPYAVSTALAAIAFAITTNSNVQAFQSSRPVAISPSVNQNAPFVTSTFHAAADDSYHYQRRSISINMTTGRNRENSASPQSSSSSLFRSTSQKTRRSLQKLRRSFTILLASFAFFLSSTRVMHTPPAHAASTATATTSSLSLTQRLNPFRARSTDEMIDAYVRDRLFSDDQYDPVESAYREAYADAGGSVSGAKDSSATSSGAYPTLLAETAGTALGQQKSVSSLLSSTTSNSGGVGTSSSSSSSGKNDGITAVIMKASDVLQSKLKVSASVSYYLLAGTGLVGICVVPGLLGVLYTGFQRLQIDKGEMKMYGKISDMDATSKRVTDDDDDDDDDDDE